MKKPAGMIDFIVPGKPQGKARARTVRLPNGSTRSFTPDKTVLYENLIKSCFMEAEARQGSRFSLEAGTPAQMELIAYFKPPRSTTKKKQKEMLSGAVRPTKKPDIDNIIKVVLDALNGIAYRDDSQICVISATKLYGEEECIKIRIKSIETNSNN